jgi:N-acetylmuramoyl-L-alanine amidase
MGPFFAFLGLILASASCAPSEPGALDGPASVERSVCEAYEEARRLSVERPMAAKAHLGAALSLEPAGTSCRRRMVALMGVLGSVEAPAARKDETDAREPDGVPDAPEPRGARSTVIVLDPGHGGTEFGATSDGLRESRLTLDIAERAARILRQRQPELEVRLTRDSDRRVSLEQRAAMANAIGADVFVSIHLNDADGDVRRGGVTTFVLDTTSDGQAIRLAARENGTTVAEVGAISVLLATLERKSQLEASRRLAERVHGETLRGARRHLPRIANRGIKPALFQVLVGARMPAILLEASFMNISGEREALRTVRYRESLARGIAQGILTYFFEDA